MNFLNYEYIKYEPKVYPTEWKFLFNLDGLRIWQGEGRFGKFYEFTITDTPLKDYSGYPNIRCIPIPRLTESLYLINDLMKEL